MYNLKKKRDICLYILDYHHFYVAFVHDLFVIVRDDRLDKGVGAAGPQKCDCIIYGDHEIRAVATKATANMLARTQFDRQRRFTRNSLLLLSLALCTKQVHDDFF